MASNKPNGRPKIPWDASRKRKLLRLYLMTNLKITDIQQVLATDGFTPRSRNIQTQLNILLPNNKTEWRRYRPDGKERSKDRLAVLKGCREYHVSKHARRHPKKKSIPRDLAKPTTISPPLQVPNPFYDPSRHYDDIGCRGVPSHATFPIIGQSYWNQSSSSTSTHVVNHKSDFQNDSEKEVVCSVSVELPCVDDGIREKVNNGDWNPASVLDRSEWKLGFEKFLVDSDSQSAALSQTRPRSKVPSQQDSTLNSGVQHNLEAGFSDKTAILLYEPQEYRQTSSYSYPESPDSIKDVFHFADERNEGTRTLTANYGAQTPPGPPKITISRANSRVSQDGGASIRTMSSRFSSKLSISWSHINSVLAATLSSRSSRLFSTGSSSVGMSRNDNTPWSRAEFESWNDLVDESTLEAPHLPSLHTGSLHNRPCCTFGPGLDRYKDCPTCGNSRMFCYAREKEYQMEWSCEADCRDKFGNTVLHHAAAAGNLAGIKIMVSDGLFSRAELAHRNTSGETFLHVCRIKNVEMSIYLELLKAVSSRGFNFSIRDYSGRTIAQRLHELTKQWHSIDHQLIVEAGAILGMKENIDYLSAPTEINCDTPLLLRLEEGLFFWTGRSELRRLVDRSDINMRDKRGYTALAIATRLGLSQLVQLLLENSANPNTRSYHGTSVLAHATAHLAEAQQKGDIELFGRILSCIVILTDHGAKPIVNDYDEFLIYTPKLAKKKSAIRKKIIDPLLLSTSAMKLNGKRKLTTIEEDAGTMDNRALVSRWLRSTPVDPGTHDSSSTYDYEDDYSLAPALSNTQCHQWPNDTFELPNSQICQLSSEGRPPELEDTSNSTTFKGLTNGTNACFQTQASLGARSAATPPIMNSKITRSPVFRRHELGPATPQGLPQSQLPCNLSSPISPTPSSEPEAGVDVPTTRGSTDDRIFAPNLLSFSENGLGLDMAEFAPSACCSAIIDADQTDQLQIEDSGRISESATMQSPGIHTSEFELGFAGSQQQPIDPVSGTSATFIANMVPSTNIFQPVAMSSSPVGYVPPKTWSPSQCCQDYNINFRPPSPTFNVSAIVQDSNSALANEKTPRSSLPGDQLTRARKRKFRFPPLQPKPPGIEVTHNSSLDTQLPETGSLEHVRQGRDHKAIKNGSASTNPPYTGQELLASPPERSRKNVQSDQHSLRSGIFSSYFESPLGNGSDISDIAPNGLGAGAAQSALPFASSSNMNAPYTGEELLCTPRKRRRKNQREEPPLLPNILSSYSEAPLENYRNIPVTKSNHPGAGSAKSTLPISSCNYLDRLQSELTDGGEFSSTQFEPVADPNSDFQQLNADLYNNPWITNALETEMTDINPDLDPGGIFCSPHVSSSISSSVQTQTNSTPQPPWNTQLEEYQSWTSFPNMNMPENIQAATLDGTDTWKPPDLANGVVSPLEEFPLTERSTAANYWAGC